MRSHDGKKPASKVGEEDDDKDMVDAEEAKASSNGNSESMTGANGCMKRQKRQRVVRNV
jgi:hypothetical protein